MKNFVAALMILCSPHTSFAGETSSCVTPSYQGVKLLVTEGAYVEYEENIHALDTVKVETQSGQVTLICYLDGTVPKFTPQLGHSNPLIIHHQL